MRKRINRKQSRRDFLKLGGGVLAGAALSRFLPRTLGQSGELVQAAGFSQVVPTPPDMHLVGTDGWIYVPGEVRVPGTVDQFYNPDNFAPEGSGFTTYMFGFRNVTGLTNEQVFAQKMKCQATAPLFWVNEGHEYRLKLTNVGLAMRPDLIDEHTVHWHGFRNAWPIFDGEPHSSVRVPIGRSLTYFYQPFHPGTYMYHCHVEETEHVHMGMTGSVFVRPAQDGQAHTYNGRTFTKFAYNDGDGSTGYDREYVINLTDIWAEAHWADSHVQLPDWTNFKADFFLMNGRSYPDTIAPNGGVNGNPFNPNDADGNLIAPVGRPELQYQPLSSLIEVNAGESVLIRLINLTFSKQSMTIPGLKMRVVGLDATPMRGTTGADSSFETHTLHVGSGGTIDAIFTAPENVSSTQTYLFYNRNFNRLSNGGAAGYGGQMTEIRVHPAGTLAPQTAPNTAEFN
ncbi:MAG: multicopper oxidase domain-containing protein [Ardenticatenaceae bacterium]|nr:multicopper oxidase domain-containing protein [Ardenticatenaceae bacterium]MCB9443871.1 multicopper oxidase domain-containing protein [Ardenticatenaceae bacterium]